MIIYYSWKGNTKIYSEILANVTSQKTFRLEEKRKRNGKLGLSKAIVQAIFKFPSEVKEMPDLSNEKEIYICSPTWKNGLAPAVIYFLMKSDLRGKEVNFILTCSEVGESAYCKKNIKYYLNEKNCKLKNIYTFVCNSEYLDRNVVKENLRLMFY